MSETKRKRSFIGLGVILLLLFFLNGINYQEGGIQLNKSALVYGLLFLLVPFGYYFEQRSASKKENK